MPKMVIEVPDEDAADDHVQVLRFRRAGAGRPIRSRERSPTIGWGISPMKRIRSRDGPATLSTMAAS